MKEGLVTNKGVEISKQEKRVVVSKGRIEIRAQGKPVQAELVRSKDTGVVYLLIDCSSSMEGHKFVQAKKGAIEFARGALTKGYSVGLIKFDDYAVHLCGPQQEIQGLIRRIKEMHMGVTTNMTSAIRLAIPKLEKSRGFRVMVITTDGMPDDEETALDEARKAKEKGIDIIAIGTDDADREFLKKLASRTDLAVKVPREELQQGIASAAKMLPASR